MTSATLFTLWWREQVFLNNQRKQTFSCHCSDRDALSSTLTLYSFNFSRAVGSPLVMDPNTICRKAKRLAGKQAELCQTQPEIVREVAKGARLGVRECQYQFRYRRWNCTSHNKYFGKILQQGEGWQNGTLYLLIPGCSFLYFSTVLNQYNNAPAMRHYLSSGFSLLPSHTNWSNVLRIDIIKPWKCVCKLVLTMSVYPLPDCVVGVAAAVSYNKLWNIIIGWLLLAELSEQ